MMALVEREVVTQNLRIAALALKNCLNSFIVDAQDQAEGLPQRIPPGVRRQVGGAYDEVVNAMMKMQVLTAPPDEHEM